MNTYQILQKELFSKVVENELLKNHTTFKIGGPAKYFFVAKNQDEVVKATKIAQKLGLPFFILGKGSNLLVLDKGFNGLVIKILNSELKIQNSNVMAGAGLELNKLVMDVAKAGLSGLEFLAGIPGTVGAAVYGNAGAFGNSISDVLVSAEILTNNQKIKKVLKSWFDFSYRNSKLKKTKEIVLSAEFELELGLREEIEKIINEHLVFRREKHPLEYPNAGSIFQNVKLDSQILNHNLEFQKIAKGGKIPAGCLIEQVGLKGYQIGQAQISEKHANFIVNLGQAKASDVLKLIELVKNKVYQQFKIKLEEEIQILG